MNGAIYKFFILVTLCNSNFLIGSVAAAAGVVFAAVLALPTSNSSAPQKTISISECEINGFGPGGSADQMRRAFGEPERDSAAKSPLNEYPHREYRYDGIRIVFSMHGRSAMSYYVSSTEYRLRSGIGVGSSWAEIIQTLGPGSFRKSGESISYVYRVVEDDGDHIPAWLTFSLDDDVVTTFSVTTR